MIAEMAHEKHGRTHVYTPQDVEYLKKFGWKIYEKSLSTGFSETPEKNLVIETSQETPETGDEKAKAITEYMVIFGKKPHHRMTTENILKAIHANGG